jgi:hypothetical protein
MSEKNAVGGLTVAVSEFWQDFSTSWATLQTNQWARFTGVDEGFLTASGGLHEIACHLNALLRSLSDDLSNYPLASRDSDFASLAAFVHDLRAPLAAMCSFSELSVLSALTTEEHFLQWRDLMLERFAKVDRVVSSNIAFFAQQQNAASKNSQGIIHS